VARPSRPCKDASCGRDPPHHQDFPIALRRVPGPEGSHVDAGDDLEREMRCGAEFEEADDVRRHAAFNTGPPHSVQTGDVPTGYAHAGHKPRLIRRLRRSANGATKNSQRIAV